MIRLIAIFLALSLSVLAYSAQTDEGSDSAKHNAFAAKTRADLDQLKGDIGKLDKEMKASAKAKYKQGAKKLEEERKDAEKKFDEMQKSSGKKWEELKSEVAASVEHLKVAFRKARQDFEKASKQQ